MGFNSLAGKALVGLGMGGSATLAHLAGEGRLAMGHELIAALAFVEPALALWNAGGKVVRTAITGAALAAGTHALTHTGILHLGTWFR